MYIMAHRGVSGFYPENTMIAFKKAIDHKYKNIELDVRLSKDGVPVVIHDATINRTSTGGKKFVHDLTVDELKLYDFGSWFDPKFHEERIPLLEEVLQLVENEKIDLNIELKNGPIIPEGFEEKVLDLVYKYKLEDRVMFSAFDHQCLQRLYNLDNKIKAGFIFHVNLIDVFNYLDGLEMDVFSIHPNYFYITDEMISEAHKRNIKVNAYTVDDLKVAQGLKAMGVDGLISNKLQTV